MKKILAGVVVLSVSTLALAAAFTNEINFANLARLWVSWDGRLNMAVYGDRMHTALDLWPTQGEKPKLHALSEVTFHRTLWDESGIEQFNISAMSDPGPLNAGYRFGVERRGPGEFRNIVFCFEDVTPGVAVCPFLIRPDGLYTSDDGGATWRRL